MSYAYNAALWCDGCAEKIIERLRDEGVEDTGDTNDFPQYAGDGGEADGPFHCDAGSECLNAEPYGAGCFLENPLTDHGYGFVKEAVMSVLMGGGGDVRVVKQWFSYYREGLEFDNDDIERLLEEAEGNVLKKLAATERRTT